MPRALTEQFGELDYTESSTLTFPRGLPGFEQCHHFVLLDEPQFAPLVHMQSLEIAELSFLALPVRAVYANYETALSAEDREAAGLDDAAEPGRATLDLALLSVATDGRLTANLLAPVVINLATRTAVQAVRADTRYSHQHVLEEASACS
jgi:flagellar assembly factor FliW